MNRSAQTSNRATWIALQGILLKCLVNSKGWPLTDGNVAMHRAEGPSAIRTSARIFLVYLAALPGNGRELCSIRKDATECYVRASGHPSLQKGVSSHTGRANFAITLPFGSATGRHA
jgi:hypothetical protein